MVSLSELIFSLNNAKIILGLTKSLAKFNFDLFCIKLQSSVILYLIELDT